MLTGATSLDLVKEELFTSMGEVEDLLQQFLEDRHNGSLLQQAIEGLQQLRGTLTLIELRGAALLLAEMIALATDIPEHDGTERNEPLSALCDGLFLLERYLQQCRHQGFERPELLLPTINQLRANRPGVPALSESHFYALTAEALPLKIRGSETAQPLDSRTFNRLRQMYQLGLLGMIRDDALAASAPLMQRALLRWQNALDGSAATLCWVAAAALDAIEQAPLQLTPARKRLFAQLDREIKKRSARQTEEPDSNPELLRELAFLVALGDVAGERCQDVRSTLKLPATGYTEPELQASFHRLRGPGVDVMRSVAEALREEITAIKDLLDLLARNAGDPEQSVETLGSALQRLWKTLSMLDLPEAAQAIEAAAGQLSLWKSSDHGVLEPIADAVLQAETAVNRLDERGSDAGPVPGSDGTESSEPVELKEARIVLIEESQAGLSLAKRAITAYMESGNDIMHLMNVPSTMETVRGGLVFLGMTRAASIIHLAGRFIQEVMLERHEVPKSQQLEVLADALAGIEFYLESAEHSAVATGDVLALAEESLAELGYTPSGS